MRYTLIIFFMLATVFSGHAQDMEIDGPLEERIESQRVAFISQRLDISPKTAQQFWPIYNDYRTKEKALQRAKTARPRIAQMNDAEAGEFIKNMMVRDQELLDLRGDLLSQLEGIVSPTQILKLIQAERAFKERLVQMLRRQRQKGR